MKKIWVTLILLVLTMHTQAFAVEDLRAYPTGRLGYIRSGYDLPPDWILDVWINPTFGPERKPVGPPAFSLPVNGGYEWEAPSYGFIRVYAEARIWDQRWVIIAVSKVLQAEATPNRGYAYGYYYSGYYFDGSVYMPGYGWGLEFQLRHFDLSYWKHYQGYQYPFRGPQGSPERK